MKPLFAVFILFSLNACQSEPRVETNVPVNKANPAAVYCHQLGGKLSLIKSQNGTTGYCTLPDGELIEEWALYRRTHH